MRKAAACSLFAVALCAIALNSTASAYWSDEFDVLVDNGDPQINTFGSSNFDWAGAGSPATSITLVGGEAISLSWDTLNGAGDTFAVYDVGVNIPAPTFPTQLALELTYSSTTQAKLALLFSELNGNVSNTGPFSADIPLPETGGTITTITDTYDFLNRTNPNTEVFQIVPSGLEPGDTFTIYSASLTLVPEPATAGIAAFGGLGLLARRRR